MFIMLFITSHAKKNLSINMSLNFYLTYTHFFPRRFFFIHFNKIHVYPKQATQQIFRQTFKLFNSCFFITTFFIINLRVLQNKFCMKIEISSHVPIDLIWCSVWYHLAYQCTIKEGPLFLTIAYTYKNHYKYTSSVYREIP